jgi:hypothetical protein
MDDVMREAEPRRVRPEVARIRAEKGEVGESSLVRRVFLRQISMAPA